MSLAVQYSSLNSCSTHPWTSATLSARRHDEKGGGCGLRTGQESVDAPERGELELMTMSAVSLPPSSTLMLGRGRLPPVQLPGVGQRRPAPAQRLR